MHQQNFKIFFSITTGPVSNGLGTKHPWVKGIQVFCSNERPQPLPSEDNNEIAKNTSKIFFKTFSRTTGLISTELATKHRRLKGIQV